MTDKILGADSARSNANVSAFPAPMLDPGVPPFDPNSPEHTHLWNSIWVMVEAKAARILREHSAGNEPAHVTCAPPAYLVEMPKTWAEACAQVEVFQKIWDDLGDDYSDDAAKAVGDAHDRALYALELTPAPDAAALVYKIRTLHASDRIQCDDVVLARICSEIAGLTE